MSLSKLNPRITVLLLMILAAAAMRIPNAAQLTPWSGYTPVGAMALFGGAYFSSRWKAILFPLLTLFISDLAINLFVFDGRYGIMHGSWYIVYGIFILLVFLGKWMITKVSVSNVVLASAAAALSHWLVADFAVWLGGGTNLITMRPLTKDLPGLLQCYVQGFPFMKQFLIGNLLYGTILFGGFELARYRYAIVRSRQAEAVL